MPHLLPVACAFSLFLGCATPQVDPAKSQLMDATVTMGPGRLPGGGDVPPTSGYRPTLASMFTFEPAYKGKDAPELRVWSIPTQGGRALAGGARPEDPAVGGRALQVIGQAFVAQGAILQFNTTWEGPVEGHFLHAELWHKGRCLANASTSIEVRFLPAPPPQGRNGSDRN